MKFLIVGAGAVGTLIGGKLALAGVDAVYHTRRPEEALWINQHGVSFREKGRDFHAGVHAYSDLPHLFAREEKVAAAVLAVKSFSTRSTLLSLAPYLHRIECFITVGNGLGNEEALFDYVDPAKIVAAAFTTACSLKKRGFAEAENRGGIALASADSAGEAGEMASVFRKAGFRVKVCPDWKAMKWSKLLLNITANATCAILDMPPHEVYQNSRTFLLERRLILEAESVMKAQKLKAVSLPCQPVPLYLWAIRRLPAGLLKWAFRKKAAGARGKKPPSLHLDFRHEKRETEWPFLYEILLEKARESRLRVPVTETLCKVLEGISTGRIPPEKFRRNPKALWDAVLETERAPGAG